MRDDKHNINVTCKRCEKFGFLEIGAISTLFYIGNVRKT
jgi:hypothetical protein